MHHGKKPVDPDVLGEGIRSAAKRRALGGHLGFKDLKHPSPAKPNSEIPSQMLWLGTAATMMMIAATDADKGLGV